MGKGKPAPRETAKEKKTSGQKAAPAKAAGKKAVAAPQSKKAPAPRKAQKPEREKPAAATGPSERARTAKPESDRAPETQTKPPAAPPVKPQGPGVTQKSPGPAPSVGESAAHKQPVHAPPAPAGQAQHETRAAGAEELEGVRLPVAAGKVGVFGGPRDRSVKPDDKLGLPTGRHYQFEQFRTLNPKSYYCAMRWEYRQQHMSTEEGKRWWANKKITVTNPANNKTVVVRAVDYGPHENSGLAIAISPGAAEAIGVEAGHEVIIAFADEKAQLGPVSPPEGSN